MSPFGSSRMSPSMFARTRLALQNFRARAQASAERNRQRDRSFDRFAEKLSRFLWPFKERWLVVVVGSLFATDYFSTYLALRNANNFEDGPLAAWALNTGGFALLFCRPGSSGGSLACRGRRPLCLSEGWCWRIRTCRLCYLAGAVHRENCGRCRQQLHPGAALGSSLQSGATDCSPFRASCPFAPTMRRRNLWLGFCGLFLLSISACFRIPILVLRACLVLPPLYHSEPHAPFAPFTRRGIWGGVLLRLYWTTSARFEFRY